MTSLSEIYLTIYYVLSNSFIRIVQIQLLLKVHGWENCIKKSHTRIHTHTHTESEVSLKHKNKEDNLHCYLSLILLDTYYVPFSIISTADYKVHVVFTLVYNFSFKSGEEA